MKDYKYVIECIDSEIRGYFKAKNKEDAAKYVEGRYKAAIRKHGAINVFFTEIQPTHRKN